MRKFVGSFLFFACVAFLFSCRSAKKVTGAGKEDEFDSAARHVLDAPELKGAHIGISVYDPTEKKYLYNYNGDKYFTPASNTKIITCYATMKHLGDSIVGMRYKIDRDTVRMIATGDPTFLHPDFKSQPVLNFINQLDNNKSVAIETANFKAEIWGVGWSWDDYFYDYMAERSAMPVYGNVVSFEGTAGQWASNPPVKGGFTETHSNDTTVNFVRRDINANNFRLGFNSTTPKKIQVPFVTDSSRTNIDLLQQLVKPKLVLQNQKGVFGDQTDYKIIHSQPIDSLLKIMMHRSDNFFAEQSLLMVSDEMLGIMNDEKIIDTLLKTDYKDLPQQPQWVDGSGLSRFNLFTPQDFVFALDKIRNEFNWNRVTSIFPTAGTGTLSSFNNQLQGKIFAKTGTLSNNVALSGYLITKQNKTLIFSVLVGNHITSAKVVRSKIEQFLVEIMEKN